MLCWHANASLTAPETLSSAMSCLSHRRNDVAICICRHGALYVAANGQGSPCLDLRRVPDVLAGAAAGADLVVIEGMGRAVHTNLRTRFRSALTF